MQQLSEVRAGRFELLGFAGNSGPDHIDHLHAMPEFLVQDIPPHSAEGFPKVTRPEIYYGETSNEYVLVRTRSQELDYPAGDQNVYSRYTGQGGVVISSWLRKLAFAARFGEIKILLSNDLAPDSRIMMYRTIGDRIRQHLGIHVHIFVLSRGTSAAISQFNRYTGIQLSNAFSVSRIARCRHHGRDLPGVEFDHMCVLSVAIAV